MMRVRALWPARVVAGHPRVVAGLVLALAAYPILPQRLGHATRAVLSWDAGSLLLLVLAMILFFTEGNDAPWQRMRWNRRRVNGLSSG
jgi:hypothetical protein